MTIVWEDDMTQLDAPHMNLLEQVARKGAANGYASLGADGLVPPAQLPAIPPLVITDADIPAEITRDTELAAGLGAKVDKDSVVVAATRILASKLLAGDAQPAFRVLGDGKQQWGPGGAGALDVSLYYFGGDLRSDRSLIADQGFTSRFGSPAQIDIGVSGTVPSILFGGDANLYRSAAGTLKTDTDLAAGGNVIAQHTLAQQVYIGNVGGSAGLGLGSSADVKLWRISASNLGTDSSLWVNNSLIVDNANGGGRLYFGSALDTTLWRAAAGQVQTDGYFIAKADIVARDGIASKVRIGDLIGNGVPGIAFGAAGGDVSLYRAAAGQLQTDGYLFAGASVYAWRGATSQVIIGSSDGTPGGNASVFFGSAADVNLARATLAAAGRGVGVKVGGHFGAGADFVARDGGGSQVVVGDHNGVAGIEFGNAADTTFYRNAAGQLRTEGRMIAADFMVYSGGTVVVHAPVVGAAKGGSLTSLKVTIDGVDRWIPVFA